jgi:NitT/TauT family transport system substrate-binding protein
MNKIRIVLYCVVLFAVVAGALAGCAPAAPKTLDKVVWVSPRGSLEVMDDANMWAAIDQGYCKDLGIDVEMQPGPGEALAVVKLVGEGQANVGYPSPGVLTAGIDAGIPVILAWEMMIPQVFDFALPKGSAIKSVKDLAGKKISVMTEGWKVIIDPMLVEAGVDPSTVSYQVAGPQWGQALAQGQADAALAWRGLPPQWKSTGMDFDYLRGSEFSKHPANGYAINKNDLNDPKKLDMWKRFFKCVAMGIEFEKQNPRAAAQITYAKFPALKEQMTPQLAFDSMWDLDCNYWRGEDLGKGIGYSDLDGWNNYIDSVYKLGQIKTRPKTEDVVTNMFVADANKFDLAKVKKDAANFKLSDEWKNVVVPAECK